MEMTHSASRFLFFLIPVIFFISCSSGAEKFENFYPYMIDGVHHIGFSYHIQEQMFSGHWSAPVLGKDHQFYRTLDKKGGHIHFVVPNPERYVMNINILDTGTNLVARINDTTVPLSQRIKYLSADLLQSGENTIFFTADQKTRIKQLLIYPARIIKYPNYKALLKDRSVLFLPGSLRYYIKPLPGEVIRLKLNLYKRERLKLRITIRGETETIEDTRTVKNQRTFRIRPLPNQFQEITLTLDQQASGYIRIEESILTRRQHDVPGGMPDEKAIRKQVLNKNVLIVLLDATRNDHVSYNGHSRRTTPNIDALAKKSLVYKNCYSESSYTLASTGTLLTGLPPDYHGVISKFYSSLDQKMTTIAELFRRKGYFSGAISGNPNFSKAFRYDKGFLDFQELFKAKKTTLAGDFIDPFRQMLARTGNRPFFIYLHIREPHHPYHMPQPFQGHFQNRYTEQSRAVHLAGKVMNKRTVPKGYDLDLLQKLYDENLFYGDWATGQILQVLQKRHLTQNTIKIFISDHGEALGENRQVGHAHVLYQPGLRIPLLVEIPGIGPASFNQPAITSDLVTTLSLLFDLDFPYGRFSRGRNLFNLPEQRRLVARRCNINNYPGYSIHQFPFKLILDFPIEHGGEELYNLTLDTGENNKLAGHDLVKKTLKFYLFNHLKNAVRLHPRILKPAFRKEDRKSLEALGYL
jgi:arylsulfatase A-like enzyme